MFKSVQQTYQKIYVTEKLEIPIKLLFVKNVLFLVIFTR